MIGRAGRPGLDTTGIAVVLTDSCSKKRIEGLLEAGIGPAKSNLVPRLPEVLNSEISQRVITNTDEILRWLQTTFLFCCLKHNDNAVSIAQKIGGEAMSRLRQIGAVGTSQLHSIHPLAASFIMNRHLVSFEQMRSITDLPFDASQCQILRCMSKVDKLHSFVKRNEKKELKEFHKTDLMKYKLPGAISKFIVKDPSEKAFILLQSYISRHNFRNAMLNDEQITVRDEAIKFLEVAHEYSVKSSRHGKVALECYKLQRSLNYALWGECSGVFNQFEWIGSSKTTSNALKFNGIRSFQDVLNVSEQKLDDIFAKSRILNLPKNAGRIVKHTARDLCRRKLLLSTNVEYTKNSNIPTDLICSLNFHDPTTTMTREKIEQDLKFSLIAYTNNSKDSSLIFEENICSSATFRVPLPSDGFNKVSIHLVGTWIGFDQKKIIDGMDTLVSSNETSIGIFQNSRPLNILTDPKASIEVKKRRRSTGSSCSLNQRRNEKRHCTEETEVKRPSPVTPQTKHHKPEVSRTYVANSQETTGEIWEESLQRGQSTTLSLTPNPIPPQADSTAITPTTHILLGRMPSSVYIRETNCDNLPAKYSSEKLATPIAKKRCSEMCSLYKCCGHIDQGQYNVPNSGINAFAQQESSASAILEKAGEIRKHKTRNQPGIQSDQWTKTRMVGRRAINSSGHSTECPPLKNSTHESREKIVWNKSRTKQQTAQKRAFTEKKMNPFKTFSHDPNDFERHLEQLSQQSSIIPNHLLARMKQSSVVSNRKCQPHFATDRNHRIRTLAYRHSNQNPQQVLRDKAFEQQFQHEKIRYHQQDFSKHFRKERNYEAQLLHPVNAWQHDVESFQTTNSRSDHPLPYPTRDDKKSKIPRSSVSVGYPNFSRKEDDPGSYPTTLGSHYEPCSPSHSHNSMFSQLPWGTLVRASEDCKQRRCTDPYESSSINISDQSQYQRLRECQQPSRQPPYSNLEFESNF